MVRSTVIALGACLVLGGAASAKKKPPPPRPRFVRPVKSATVAPPPAASDPAPAPVADIASPRPSPPKNAPPRSGREVVERESKIEFDERAIQGQTAAGAIYLFQRGESDFRSMIQVPESFRELTVKQILPEPPKP